MFPRAAQRRPNGIKRLGALLQSLRGTTLRPASIFKVGFMSLHREAVRFGDQYLLECEIQRREKDTGSTTADWFSELLSPNPWFKDVVPNV